MPEARECLKSWIVSSDLSDTMSDIEASQTGHSDVFRGNDEADVDTGKNGQDFHGCYCSSVHYPSELSGFLYQLKRSRFNPAWDQQACFGLLFDVFSKHGSQANGQCDH